MRMSINPKAIAFTLALSVAPSTFAMGSKNPSPTPTPPATQPKPDNGSALIDLGINLAIAYAQTQPRYVQVLSALGITDAAALKSFLQFNGNGINFRNIVAHLIYQRAQSDAKVKSILQGLGLNSEVAVRNFLSNPSGGLNYQALLDAALAQAMANSKYATWLKALKIQNVQDIKNLLKGDGKSGNLMSIVMVFGLEYAQSKEKLKQYVPIIQAVLATYGITPGLDGTNGEGSDDDIIGLGAFQGMTVGETKAVQAIK